MTDNIVKTIEGIGAAFDKYRDGSVKAQAAMLDRIEDLEARASMPGKTDGPGTPEAKLHKSLFEDFIRHPFDGSRKQALGDFQQKLEGKSINLGSNADGAFAMPTEIARDIEKMEIKLSPVRRLVKVVRCSTGDFKHLVSIGGASAGWVGESDSRSETNTPQLRERAPSFGEIYAYPAVTEHALDDIFFNVQQWLVDEVSEQFALYEGEAVIRGNGTNKPKGLLYSAPVSTADDAASPRDADKLQYILGADNSPASLDYDALVDVMYSLNSRYKAGANWVMNSSTAGNLAKLKDSALHPLWQPSMAQGSPPTLMGFPVELWEQVDDVLGGQYPVLFGNFARAYVLADRTDIRITVDANITTPGKVKFFVRRREGGCILNNDALKVLKAL